MLLLLYFNRFSPVGTFHYEKICNNKANVKKKKLIITFICSCKKLNIVVVNYKIFIMDATNYKNLGFFHLSRKYLKHIRLHTMLCFKRHQHKTSKVNMGANFPKANTNHQ